VETVEGHARKRFYRDRDADHDPAETLSPFRHDSRVRNYDYNFDNVVTDQVFVVTAGGLGTSRRS
jgi:hypothetical protein